MARTTNAIRIIVVPALLLGLSAPRATGEEPSEEARSEQGGAATEQIREPTPQAVSAPPPNLRVYIPPSRGAPKTRSGAGTRGTGNPALSLYVLGPDHVGLTLAEQPTLYWYISDATDTRVEFTVSAAEAVKPLLETTLAGPIQAGVHPLALADFGVRLEAGKTYEWSVALVPDPNRRSADIIAGDAIRRIAGDSIQRTAAAAGLQEEIASTEESQTYLAYAQHGIWYDTIAALSKQITSHPEDRLLRDARVALLEQVGLEEVARHDRRALGAP